MNELYKEISLNLMLIENEEHPLVRMITYAKNCRHYRIRPCKRGH